MYFTGEEVKLIRAAAALMPAGGERDAGKAQLSSLADLAARVPLDHLLMDIEARENAVKFHRNRNENFAIADALRKLVDHITSAGRASDTEESEERYLMRKRANALRYVNRLRRPRSGKYGRRRPRGS